MLWAIRPALGVGMLAAASAEWVHHQKRAIVIYTRTMVLLIAHHHVGSGHVPERPEIRHYCRGIGIKRHALAMIRPTRIPGEPEQHFIRVHLLHHAAGL